MKSELARHHADDIYAYCDIKDPVCDILMAAAEDRAQQTEWQVGRSDS